MRKVIETEKIPIKLWLNDIDEGAMQQARNLANLPFAFKHIAIMPDSHQGYGMPIGGVLATKEIIIPNAVGVDIGCGMCAIRTPLKKIEQKSLLTIVQEIKRTIPLGFNHHKRSQDERFMPNRRTLSNLPITCQEYESARTQVGTLGGGNHFIEIQAGSDGHVWIMIHSGSRNIGYKVAHHYNQVAKKLSKKHSPEIPKHYDLAFLPLDSKEGRTYFKEMQYCIDFALANRKLMMSRVLETFTQEFPNEHWNIEAGIINIAHNYASKEKHFKQEVVVHRKGATRAMKDQFGIIPGSQGTKSYIVKGRGNRDSFMSCSHGAGRKMGRKQAIRELSLEEERENLNQRGIIHSICSKKDLDEAPSAYKDIGTVMKNQDDLIEIMIELKPLAVVKG